VVTGSSADDEGGDAADLKGTVFAVRAFIKEGTNDFFVSFCGGGGASVEAGKDGDAGGGTLALVGSGGVLASSAFTNDARDTFFVL
jgi:hypothetical protein